MPCYLKIKVTNEIGAHTSRERMSEALEFMGFYLHADQGDRVVFGGSATRIVVDYANAKVNVQGISETKVNEIANTVKKAYARAVVYHQARQKKWKVRENKNDPYKLTVER